MNLIYHNNHDDDQLVQEAFSLKLLVLVKHRLIQNILEISKDNRKSNKNV
jgi:hypothetical protein